MEALCCHHRISDPCIKFWMMANILTCPRVSLQKQSVLSASLMLYDCFYLHFITLLSSKNRHFNNWFINFSYSVTF